MRQNDPDPYASSHRITEGCDHIMLQDQIRSHNINVSGGPLQNIHIDEFSHRFSIQRTVCIGDHIPRINVLRLAWKNFQIILIIVFVSLQIPQLQKHLGQTLYRISFYHNGRIFPVTKAFFFVNIFIRQIGTSGESGLTVDHKNFSVITIILIGTQRRFDR